MKAALAAMLVFIGALQAAVGHQSRSKKVPTEAELLARPVTNFPSTPLTVHEAFQLALLGSGTPGGQIINEACTGGPHADLRSEGGSLKEVLDDIARADSEYEWVVEDGVVDLVPNSGVPDLLTLRLSAYDSGDATSIGTAGTFLFALPEVRARANELGIPKSAAGSGLYGMVRGRPPSAEPLGVHLRDVTLLGVLNALVRANNRGIWIYREMHCETHNAFDINFTQ